MYIIPKPRVSDQILPVPFVHSFRTQAFNNSLINNLQPVASSVTSILTFEKKNLYLRIADKAVANAHKHIQLFRVFFVGTWNQFFI